MSAERDCIYRCVILHNQGPLDIYDECYREWHDDDLGNAQ